jgi:hypothetical protein
MSKLTANRPFGMPYNVWVSHFLRQTLYRDSELLTELEKQRNEQYRCDDGEANVITPPIPGTGTNGDGFGKKPDKTKPVLPTCTIRDLDDEEGTPTGDANVDRQRTYNIEIAKVASEQADGLDDDDVERADPNESSSRYEEKPKEEENAKEKPDNASRKKGKYHQPTMGEWVTGFECFEFKPFDLWEVAKNYRNGIHYDSVRDRKLLQCTKYAKVLARNLVRLNPGIPPPEEPTEWSDGDTVKHHRRYEVF